MNVNVWEEGRRPPILTTARRFAPAGAKVFGEVLGQQKWADFAFVVLDWENSHNRMPDEVAMPVLYVQVHVLLPQYETRNHLTVEERFDVDDVFGNDEMTAEVIMRTVLALEQKVQAEVARRTAN